MDIKTKLAIQFTIIVVVILLFSSVLVYYFSNTSQSKKFNENLLNRAKNTAILLINVDEVDSTLLKKIHHTTFSWEKEEIVLTDSSLKAIYTNNTQYINNEIINSKYLNSELNFFSFKDKDGVHYKHVFKNHIYHVFVLAFDKARHDNLSNLKTVLIWSFLFSIWLSILLSYIFAKNAIQPISRIIKSVKAINPAQLSKRINEGKRKDEIDQLAITFNEMLANLEVAFKNQQDFVSNAAHELRTPLAVMIVESDYFLSKNRTQEEYINHISNLTKDLKKLNLLYYSLLELAQLNSKLDFQLSDTRIDEIVYNVILQLKTNFKDRKIITKIQYPENDNDLIIKGNQGLLHIAFKNLLENALKFSDEDVVVEFTITSLEVKVTIIDKGIGIPSAEIENIFKPFKRAPNVKFKSGFGIGLALVAKIMELHEISIKVNSEVNKGTCFELTFKRIAN